jgi:hypothetical protein
MPSPELGHLIELHASEETLATFEQVCYDEGERSGVGTSCFLKFETWEPPYSTSRH